MSRLPDLVKDSKLETEFHARYTTHVFHEASSRQRKPRREYWTREKYIARGGFGVVWRERCARGHGEVEVRAVKQVPKPARAKDYLRELEAIAKFSHPRYVRCFVKSFGWYEDDDHLYIAMEYLPEGDLYHYLAKGQRLPEIEAQQIAFQLTEALSYMHENGFAHRDLKPQNILIYSKPPKEWWVKVADFGISKRVGDVLATHSTIKGTPAYMAPECQGYIDSPEGEPTAADIWALGEIVHNMLTLKPTFDGRLRERELFKYVDGRRDFSDISLQEFGASDAAIQFVRAAMKPEPNNRMTIQQALEHEWMSVFTRETSRPASITSLNMGESDGTGQTGADDEFSLSLSEASARWTTMQITVDEGPNGLGTLSSNAPKPAISSISDQTVIQHQEVQHLELRQSVSEPAEVSPDSAANHRDKAALTGTWTISFDGKWIATVPDKRPLSAKIWQASTGELYRTICPLPSSADSRSVRVAFSPTADILAVRFEGYTARTHIYSIDPWAQIRTINHLESDKLDILVEFSTDGQQIAYNTELSVRIESVAEVANPVQYLLHSPGKAQAIMLDDKHLAVAFENLIEIWDVRVKGPYKKIRLHSYSEGSSLIQPQWSRNLEAIFYFTLVREKTHRADMASYRANIWKRGNERQSHGDHLSLEPEFYSKDPARVPTALSRNGKWWAMLIKSGSEEFIEVASGDNGLRIPVASRRVPFGSYAFIFLTNSEGKEVLAIAWCEKGAAAPKFEIWDFQQKPWENGTKTAFR